MPRSLAEDGLADSTLEIVLPEQRLPPTEMSVVYHGIGAKNPRADVLATFLQAEVQGRKDWSKR